VVNTRSCLSPVTTYRHHKCCGRSALCIFKMEKSIIWAKVQVLFYIQLNIILSGLLSKPTYNQSLRYCSRGYLQSVFLKGFTNKHDRRSAGPRVPVCTSQRTQPAWIIKNNHDDRSQIYVRRTWRCYFFIKKKREYVGSGIVRLFAPEPNRENGRP